MRPVPYGTNAIKIRAKRESRQKENWNVFFSFFSSPLIPPEVSAFHPENLYVQQHPVLCCFLILCFFGATIIKVVKDT